VSHWFAPQTVSTLPAAPKPIQLDLEIALPNSRACKTDSIEDALDYALIVEYINESLAEKPIIFTTRSIRRTH
jgi:dihydroneopterin aldolase